MKIFVRVCCLLVLSASLSGCAALVELLESDPEPEPWASIAPMPTPVMFASRAESSIRIDGRLREQAWQNASPSSEFGDIALRPGHDPTEKTSVRIVWDDMYLYIGAIMEESDVWATLTEQNSVIFHDNDFEVFLDPDGDFHNYHEFEINALGTFWELTLERPYRDGAPMTNPDNLPGMEVAVQVDGTLNDPSDEDSGWTVEMAIPWSSLRRFDSRALPPSQGVAWLANFSRVEWPLAVVADQYKKDVNSEESNWTWAPTGIVDIHRPERWGWLVFTEQAPENNALWLDDEPSPAWSPEVVETFLQLKHEASIRNLMMAWYYHAAHHRSSTGSWPVDTSILPAYWIPEGVCFNADMHDNGYFAEARRCRSSIGGAQESQTGHVLTARYTIDHLGHLERHVIQSIR